MLSEKTGRPLLQSDTASLRVSGKKNITGRPRQFLGAGLASSVERANFRPAEALRNLIRSGNFQNPGISQMQLQDRVGDAL
jgi:hypothetical protein